ncbi:MAG: helix-hairpin-helix domain-containing protein [Rhodocyclales bacterium]|nr:helix-hairpin-helix domain-containing protein [Rhodocyclales bacterium]
MKARFIPVILTTALLLLGADLSLADEAKTGEATAASKQSKADKQKEISARRKAVAKIKPVNINSASAEQLKKLPGVGDAEAAKIIAGRPYGSKAWLVTNNIISDDLYESLKTQIVAGPPFDPKKVKAPAKENK